MVLGDNPLGKRRVGICKFLRAACNSSESRGNEQLTAGGERI